MKWFAKHYFSVEARQGRRNQSRTLALHGPQAGVLEEQPVVHFVVLARPRRIGNLVLGVIPRDEVLHDGTGFKQADALAVGKGVGQGGNAAIGVDGKKPGLFLRILADVNFLGLVGEAIRKSAGGLYQPKRAYPSSSKVMDTLMPLGVWAV